MIHLETLQIFLTISKNSQKRKQENPQNDNLWILFLDSVLQRIQLRLTLLILENKVLIQSSRNQSRNQNQRIINVKNLKWCSYLFRITESLTLKIETVWIPFDKRSCRKRLNQYDSHLHFTTQNNERWSKLQTQRNEQSDRLHSLLIKR